MKNNASNNLDENINKAVRGVLVRIIFFVVYYLCLIALGVLLLYGTFIASVWFWTEMLPSIDNGRGIIFAIVCWAGICCMAVMLGAFLVKPLFSFGNNEKKDRVEVTRQTCPKLFEAIDDIVTHVGAKKPKHVYLTTDVNACVFYNQSIWAIFFPVSKNLEVGLGLIEGTSEMELKAILAHEFGHFAQNSMKVGSTVYVVGSIINNLLNGHDYWDDLIEKWVNSDLGIFSFFGGITAMVANFVNKMNLIVYKHIAISNGELSRYMEYDADNVSCKYAGTSNVVSAFRKIEILASSSSKYQDSLVSLAQCGGFTEDYFHGKKIYDHVFNENKIEFTYSKLLGPNSDSDDKGLIKHIHVVNLLDDHPSMDDRIANALHQNIQSPTVECTPAEDMFSAEIKKEVGSRYLELIKDAYPDAKKISMEDYRQRLQEIYIAPDCCKHFYERTITPFDLEQCKQTIPSTSPFNEQNENIIKQYQISASELEFMQQVQDMDDKDHLKVYYDDKECDKDYLPIEKQKKIAETQLIKVMEIDRNVFAYIYGNVDNDDKECLEYMYQASWYAEKMKNSSNMLPKLMNSRNILYNALVSNTKPDQDAFDMMYIDYTSLGTNLIQFIKSLSPEYMSLILSQEQFNSWRSWSLDPNGSIEGDKVKQMFNMIDQLEQMFNVIISQSHTTMEKIADKVLV